MYPKLGQLLDRGKKNLKQKTKTKVKVKTFLCSLSGVRRICNSKMFLTF